MRALKPVEPPLRPVEQKLKQRKLERIKHGRTQKTIHLKLRIGIETGMKERG